MAEVMIVTWKPPCLVFEPTPRREHLLRQSFPEHGEAGKGPVMELILAVLVSCPVQLILSLLLSLYHGHDQDEASAPY